MITVTIIGFIIRMFGLQVSSSGVPFIRYVVSARNSVKQSDSNKQNSRTYLTLVAFGKAAEFLSKYFTEGSPIWVEAEIRNNNYKDASGLMHYDYDFLTMRAGFAGYKTNTPSTSAVGTVTQPTAQAFQAASVAASGKLPFPTALSRRQKVTPEPQAVNLSNSQATVVAPAVAPAAAGTLPSPSAPSTQPAPLAASPTQPMATDAVGIGQGLTLGKLKDVFTADEMTFGTSADVL